jgi:DNA-binding transcriptional LysR family regulator
MKLNSSQLEAFYSVAQHLHFTKAAAEINVTQSALSQRIAKLEEDLETTLFILDRSSIRLTDAGSELLRFCERQNSLETELLQSLKGSGQGHSGTLRIGGFSSVMRSLLVPAIKPLMIENPNLSLSLVTKELRELADLLRRSEVDYILTDQKSESDDIESLFLGVEENVLCVSKKHSEVEVFLDHDSADPTTAWYFRQSGGKAPRRLRYMDDVYGLIDGVKQGFGKAILPRHLIEGERDLVVLDEKRVLKTYVYLNFYRQPYYRKLHDEVVADVKTFFSKALG